MTEQERKKAFENQRRNAERRAKEADGTYDMERRIQYEKKQREERRLQQQRQALKQRITAAVIAVAALIVIAVLFRSCNKKDDKLFQTMPVQTSQEEITSGQIEEANEPEVKATVPTTQEEIQETNPLETVGETEQVQQPAESVAATVNAVDTAQHVIDPSGIVIPDWITVDLIHINNVSRPAIALDAVNDIAIHYVANPGSSAKANRDYFDSLDNPAVEGAGRQASAHLIVGLDGEVVQCLPLNEMAYAVRSRNPDTISIEVCHPDETGKFSDTTYNTLVKLTAWLLQQKGLTPDHVIRHFDCDGNIARFIMWSTRMHGIS